MQYLKLIKTMIFEFVQRILQFNNNLDGNMMTIHGISVPPFPVKSALGSEQADDPKVIAGIGEF